MVVGVLLLFATVILLIVVVLQLRKQPQRLNTSNRRSAMVEELNRKLLDQKSELAEANGIAARALQELEKQKQVAKIVASIGDEQANKLMLFAKMADDFRTPATLVIGPLENALNEKYGNVPDELRKRLHVALRNARHLLRQINRFHDISKLQRGSIELKPARRNMVIFMNGIAQLFEESAEKRNISLSVTSDRETMDVYFDSEKMDEVFYHLVANAFKYTPNDGIVRVSLTSAEPNTDYPEGSIQISIKDTGKGMPQDELARLSEIIQRDATALEPGVRQYGLALLTDIVFHHGGRIEVDSAFNKGTEFRIVLPLGNAHFADIEIFEEPEEELMALEKEPSVQPAIADVAPPENTKNVLVVEDNPDIRELIKDCLKDHYRVTEATDGKDALEKVNESAPDVIISDVLMPGMDGFDLCRALKTDKALHHIPVLLLTAKSSDLMRIQGVEAGADAYIPKPFSPEQLIEKVKSLARERAES